MATKRVIDLTETERLAAVDDAVAASLAALGVTKKAQSTDDQVFEAFVEAMRAAGDFVKVSDVAQKVGLGQNSASAVCARLMRDGRMERVRNPNTGRTTYVPLVAKK